MNNKQIGFERMNAFFDHIYIISLHRATDRHEHFKKELDGLNYSIFWGKDKNEFDIEQLKQENIYNEELAIKHHRYNKPMAAGMLGCTWSHKLVYEDMLKNKYQKVFIMEDDIVVDTTTFPLLSTVLDELPKDWELFYLGFALHEPSAKSFFVKKMFYHFAKLFNGIKLSHKEIANRFPKKISAHIYKAGYHDCAHAYGITNACAEKLIALQTPISHWSDHLLAYASTNDIIKAYIVMPKMINQIYQLSSTTTHSYINK
jgi:glycosyl transferase family 25